MYKKYFKRLLDIVLSLFGLVILSPVFTIAILPTKEKRSFSRKDPAKTKKRSNVVNSNQ
jgi:lipopolysaccharide/colanic/teichoic acid biosynthesis glycosyltransferase